MNPNFHNRERYDCALLQVYNGFVIGRVLGIIGVDVDGKEHQLAITVPYDEPVIQESGPAETRQYYKPLRFHRLRSRPYSKACVVMAASIIRGALMVQDFRSQYEDDFLVVDVIDADFWLRFKQISHLLVTKARL
jgi:hypothetical protein